MKYRSKVIQGSIQPRRHAIAFTSSLVVTLSALTSQGQSALPSDEPTAPTPAASTVPPPAAPQATTPGAVAATPEGVAPSASAGEGASAQTEPVPAPSAASTAPAAPPAEASEADAAASAQADQIANELAASGVTQGSKLNIYGFADFTFAKRLSHHSTDFILPRTSTFYVGNFNVYLSGELGRWRSLAEVRFTYLPNGVESLVPNNDGTVNRTSTAYPDYADWGRPQKVGGVIIERVWLEYSAHELLTIRAGQFLTPYGIWNVDHGSPVVIGITRPFIVGNEWLPNRQTGMELYGSYGVNSTQFGYHLTLSNGRGPIDEYQDLDSNKAVGWRAWAKHESPIGTFQLGTSGYKGRYTDSRTQYSFTGGPTQFPIVQRYDELSLAADFKWTWGGYLLQSEAIMHDTRYDSDYRPTPMFSPPGSGWQPDSRVWGYYALTGYRFKWNGVMPFVQNQYQNWGKGQFLTVWEFSGGINARPNEMVVLKVAALWLWRPDHSSLYSKTESQFAAQVAWSF